LVLGSILSFLGLIFVLFAFASPYWLVSWEYTFSPFQSMGLWEFCFKNYRHPHFQFDKLFNGCHYVFSEEYRIIREWLLPGWLQVVQAFCTLGFMSSLGAQLLSIPLIAKWPLKLILNMGWVISLISCIANGGTAFFLFLTVSIFGGQCFRRDWLQYPNFNYLSWAYAFAVVAMFLHAISALLLYGEFKAELNRYREGDGHQEIPMHPTGSPNGHNGRESGSGGDGMSNPVSESHSHRFV